MGGQAVSQLSLYLALFVPEPYYLSSAAAGAVDLSNPPSLPGSQLTAVHSSAHTQTHADTHLHVGTIKTPLNTRRIHNKQLPSRRITKKNKKRDLYA